MKVSIKIGNVEVTMAEETTRTSREYDSNMICECIRTAKEFYFLSKKSKKELKIEGNNDEQ